MPKKRRRLAAMASGLGSGASDVIGLLLQSKLIGDRQNEQADRLVAGQTLDDVRERLKAVVNPTHVGEVGPDRANAEYDAAMGVLPTRMRPLLGDRPDFSTLDTTPGQRIGALTKEVSEITNPDDLRLTREGLQKRAPGMRVATEQAIPNLLPGSAGLDSSARTPNEDFEALVKSATGQREGLLAKEERTATPYIDESGTQFTGHYSNREKAGLGSLQTERTPQQQGEREGTIAKETEIGKEQGLGATEADRTARTVREYEAMTPAEMGRFARQEAIRLNNDLTLATRTAQMQLEMAGKAEEAKALRKLTTDATAGMAGMEEMAALATEVNSGFTEGGMDMYAGLRQTFDTMPYIGASVSSLMTALGAAGTAIADQDPTMIRKIMRLQAGRREMAIGMISAAGDPRPSDADVIGVLSSVPGPFESRQQTAEKIQFIRDRTLAIPELLAANPGLRGKALLDAAADRARGRAGGRASVAPEGSTGAGTGVGAGRTGGGLSPLATGALEILNAR